MSEEEKEEFEDTFDDDPVIEDTVLSSELNTWVYNTDTIDSVLSVLLDKGIKVEGGDKLGKTIIFAKNNRHAKAIVDRFLARFPRNTVGILSRKLTIASSMLIRLLTISVIKIKCRR